MRKLRFKKWVTNLLIIIALLSMLVVSGECESDSLFFIKGIVGTIVFSSCSLLILKYSNL